MALEDQVEGRGIRTGGDVIEWRGVTLEDQVEGCGGVAFELDGLLMPDMTHCI